MRVRLAVVILLVVTSGAAAVSAAAQGSGVTPEAAEQVARDYADANARNNATLDVEGQAAIEDPPIRAIDDATFREYRGRGQTSLGQDIRVEDRRIYVPQQSGYPLRFLSSERVVFGGEPAARQLLLFVKTSESAPWRVSMAAQVVKASLPKLRTDSDGLARLVGADAEPALKVKPDALAPKLAKLWDSGRSTSKTFEPGPLTTGAVDSFVQSLSATGIGQARVRFEFGPAEDRPVCFQTTVPSGQLRQDRDPRREGAEARRRRRAHRRHRYLRRHREGRRSLEHHDPRRLNATRRPFESSRGEAARVAAARSSALRARTAVARAASQSASQLSRVTS